MTKENIKTGDILTNEHLLNLTNHTRPGSTAVGVQVEQKLNKIIKITAGAS